MAEAYIEDLKAELRQKSLDLIELRNPGIDMEEVIKLGRF